MSYLATFAAVISCSKLFPEKKAQEFAPVNRMSPAVSVFKEKFPVLFPNQISSELGGVLQMIRLNSFRPFLCKFLDAHYQPQFRDAQSMAVLIVTALEFGKDSYLILKYLLAYDVRILDRDLQESLFEWLYQRRAWDVLCLFCFKHPGLVCHESLLWAVNEGHTELFAFLLQMGQFCDQIVVDVLSHAAAIEVRWAMTILQSFLATTVPGERRDACLAEFALRSPNAMRLCHRNNIYPSVAVFRRFLDALELEPLMQFLCDDECRGYIRRIIF